MAGFGRRDPEPQTPQDGIEIAHRATGELRAAAALMGEAQRVANFGSWEWRVADDDVSWSDQLYRIFGLDPETFDATLAGYLEHVHEDDREHARKEIEAGVSEQRAYRMEHRIVRPTGEERVLRCHGEPVVDSESGKVVRVVGVCQDVTELALTEQARDEADARFRSAFENAPIGIALVDFGEGPDGRLTEVNRALGELTGRPQEELVGMSLPDLALSEDADLDLALRERLVAGEIDRFSIEKRALFEDRLVWFQFSISALPDQRPTVHGIVQVQDVTERKRFEEQLRYIADHDSLTGLMNRRRFREELDSHLALQRRYGGEGALLARRRRPAEGDQRQPRARRRRPRAAARRRGDARAACGQPTSSPGSPATSSRCCFRTLRRTRPGARRGADRAPRRGGGGRLEHLGQHRRRARSGAIPARPASPRT